MFYTWILDVTVILLSAAAGLFIATSTKKSDKVWGIAALLVAMVFQFLVK